MRQPICQNCGRVFEHKITVKYCSQACKQAAYRTRKGLARNAKSKSGRCIRCGDNAPRGSRYCGNSCKVMTNREKQTSTFKTMKELYHMNDYQTWQLIADDWKKAYAQLENMQYRYNASNHAWEYLPALQKMKGFE